MYGYQMACGSSCASVDYADALSRWAKVELLKEKVKQRMEKVYGARLDKVADIVVELAQKRAEGAQELSASEEALEEELGALED